MIQGNAGESQVAERTPEDTPSSGGITLDKAREYEHRRFGRRPRMRRLDRREKAFARHVLEMTGAEPRIVDIPCGSGRFFDIFAGAKDLVMADLSENMLDVVRERIDLPPTARLLKADVTEIPLPSASADLCFCMRLFHHFGSDEIRLAALRELSRISVAYVALSFYNKHCARYYWRRVLGKKIRGDYTTLRHLAGLARQAGLEVYERVPRWNVLEQQCLVVFKKS